MYNSNRPPFTLILHSMRLKIPLMRKINVFIKVNNISGITRGQYDIRVYESSHMLFETFARVNVTEETTTTTTTHSVVELPPQPLLPVLMVFVTVLQWNPA